MTRKKIRLQWISNDTARKASLKKRRVGLLKKVSELTVLCGVDAFCIIYSPDDVEPIIWPNHSTIERLLKRYQELPEIERFKKMMNQESYLKERICKAYDQSRKYQRKNKEMDLTFMMQQLHQGKNIDDFDLSEMQSFAWLIQEKIRDIMKRIDILQQVPPSPSRPFTSEHVPSIEEISFPTRRVITNSGKDGIVNPFDTLHWDQLFVDIVMNNENGAGSGNTRSDIGLPYEVYNRSHVGSGNGINMEIDHLYGNVKRTDNNDVFSLRFLNYGNFLGGGTNRNGIGLELPYNMEDNNYGGDAIGLRLPHEALEGGDKNGVLLEIMGFVNDNIEGNNEGNDNIVDLGLPYENWEGGNDNKNFSNVEVPYNEVGGTINERNRDNLIMPNENLAEIECIAKNNGINDQDNIVGMGLTNDLNGNSSDSIVKSNVGFHVGFF